MIDLLQIGTLAGATPWGAIAGAASGLLSAGIGIAQRAKARKELKNLKSPVEELPPEVAENQRIATQLAATGMPSEQYNQAMRNIQRTQMMAIRGAQDRRSGSGLIPNIQMGTNTAKLGVDAKSAEMRIGNQRNLMDVNRYTAGQKRSIFDVNVRDKFDREWGAAQDMLGSGNRNITGGFDKLAAGGIDFARSGGFAGGANKDAKGLALSQRVSSSRNYAKPIIPGIPRYQ